MTDQETAVDGDHSPGHQDIMVANSDGPPQSANSEKKQVTFSSVNDTQGIDLWNMKDMMEDQAVQQASNALAEINLNREAEEDEALFKCDDISDVKDGGAVGADGEESSEYEMVDEEGEEEIDEMADSKAKLANGDASSASALQENAAEVTEVKKKRMVRRKKKKKEALEPKVIEEAKCKDQSVQMPAWTEALEIEYMTQDQLKRVLAKLRDGGMTQEDIELGEDLYYKRAAFQMDKFVKMSEIRELVQTALHSILDRMRKADELARKNRAEISVMDSKLKTQQMQVSHLKRMDNGQNQLIKMQKDQELKLHDVQSQLADWKYENHVKTEERRDIDADIQREISRLRESSATLSANIQYLTDQQQKAREHLNEFTEHTSEVFVQRLSVLENRVTLLPAVLKQQVLSVEIMKEEIILKSQQQFQEICSGLKVDSERILEVEESLKRQKEFEKKVEYLNSEVLKLRQSEDGIFQTHCFIERTLPMMIHHQVCEAVNIVAGPNLEELKAFERKKTDEVYEHSKLCEGLKPNLKQFRKCIEKFTECAWKFKIGAAPFTYGEQKDYWAEITPRFFQSYDKRAYLNQRHLPIQKKLHEAEEDKRQEMESHINFLFMSERENTKAMIHSTVSTMKGGLGRQQTTRGVKPGTTKPLPNAQHPRRVGLNPSRMQEPSLEDVNSLEKSVDYRSGDQKTANVSRTNSRRPSKKPSTNQLVNSQKKMVYASQQEMPASDNGNPVNAVKIEDGENLLSLPQSEKQEDSHDEEEGEGEFYNDRPLSGDQSQSQYQSESKQTRVVHEVKIINDVKVVHKVDKVALHKLKQQCASFMSHGRSEFNRQLNKWQEFFDETHDDQFSMETRMEKLETLVNILTDNLTDLEARSPATTPEEGAESQESNNNSALFMRRGIPVHDKKRNFTMATKNGNKANRDELGSIEESNAEQDERQQTMDNALDAIGDGPRTQAVQHQRNTVIINTSKEQVLSSLPSTDGILSPARKQRLSRLEDTQKLLNTQTPTGLRRMTQQTKIVTMTSTLTADSVSSMNTVEKNGNKEADSKVAGNSFNFAKEFQRTTMSRGQLTSFVQKKWDQMMEKTMEFQDLAEKRYQGIMESKELIIEENREFQRQAVIQHQSFTNFTEDYMRQKGMEAQKMLLQRIDASENHVQDFETRLKLIERQLLTLADRIAQEYKDFISNRKRWKSDFATATDKAVQNLDKIRSMLSGCENQNIVNTSAIKMMLDAQMIEQIVQRQEIEDRKRLLVMAHKTDQELLSTDLGVHAREIVGPRGVSKRDLTHDRAKSQSGKQQQQPSKQNNGTNTNQCNQEDATREFADNACRVDPPILKVDRHCMNCADNKSTTLNAIKVACLTHTQSAIPYQGKNYHVSDLLDVKAKVVAQCQRMLRENLFQTKNNAGVDIRAEDNEKSFIITPLALTVPIKVETKIHDVMRGMSYRQQHESPRRQSIRNDQSPTTQGRSIEPRQDNMYARYPDQGSPNYATEDTCILEIEGEKILDENNYKGLHEGRDETVHILSNQQNVSTNTKQGRDDDLFSSNANFNSTQHVSVAQKIQRGTSQMTSHKIDTGAVVLGRANFGHIRFSSSSRIHHNAGKQQVSENFEQNNVRRSLFDQQIVIGHGNKQEMTPGLPDVQQQRGAFPQKFGNLDFEHMFESSQHAASTKHSQVRQSSVLSSTTTQQMFQPKQGMQSTRYTANRIGQSVLEDNYRASDGFKNMPMKKNLAQKKHSELTGANHRPQTQDGNSVFISAQRVNSFGSAVKAKASHNHNR